MEEAVKEWFSVGPHDKVNYDVNIMTAQGPLGMLARLGLPGYHLAYSAERNCNQVPLVVWHIQAFCCKLA